MDADAVSLPFFRTRKPDFPGFVLISNKKGKA